VTLPYDPTQVSKPQSLKLFHYEDGAWVDCTVSVDTVAHTITGRVNSLSPFEEGEQEDGPPAPIPDASEWALIILAIGGAAIVVRGSRKQSRTIS